MTYHFDANTFGNPSYPVSQTQEGQFVSNNPGGVGRGLYRDYNPTGPIPVSLRYQWDGTTFGQFRSDWRDATKMNHGANWFTIDLPLMLEIGAEADGFLYAKDIPVTDPITGATTYVQPFQRYRVHAKQPFQASMEGYDRWVVTLEAEVDVSLAADDWLAAEFDADFLTGSYRDSGVVASIPSLGTIVEANGDVKWAPHNFVQTSNDVSGGFWLTYSGGTLSGTKTMTFTTAASYFTINAGSNFPSTRYMAKVTLSGSHPGDQFRFELVDGAWSDQGMLLESEARTNMIPYSVDYAQWAAENEVTTDPAMKVIPSTNSAEHFYQSTSAGVAVDTIHTFWADVEAGGYDYFALTMGASRCWASFDLARGVVTATSSNGTDYKDESATIIPWGPGKYRVALTFTPVSGTSDQPRFGVMETLAGTYTEIFAGNGTSGVFVYRTQVEAGAYPSSFIPTIGANVTRGGEGLTAPAASLPWNTTAFSIALEGTMTYRDENVINNAFLLNWQNGGERINTFILTSDPNTGLVIVESNEGSNYDNVQEPSPGSYSEGENVPFSIASRHGTTFLNAAVDGKVLTENTTPTAVPNLAATDMIVGSDFMGHIARVRVWGQDIGDAGIGVVSK